MSDAFFLLLLFFFSPIFLLLFFLFFPGRGGEAGEDGVLYLPLVFGRG